MDKDIITDFNNLYKAYRKAKVGKKYNGSLARFDRNAIEGIMILQEQLKNQNYSVGKYNEFKIYEPKERIITSCQFKDKVVQHCLCDNVLLPRLSKEFIYSNSAGQIGKGTHYALDVLKEQMLDYYKENGYAGWILKCDISKFFYKINHDMVKDIVDYYFPEDYTIWLNHLFIDSTKGLGLPLGNQVAQVYALLMLNGLDHFVTGELGISKYGRYMDDFYLIHHSKEYLKYCLSSIDEFLKNLGLSLNNKTQIVPIKNGIKFLGFHHYITSNGKYIRKICGQNKRKEKKRIRIMIKRVKRGIWSEKEFLSRYQQWKQHAMHGNCYKLCQSMDKYVENLMKGESVGKS